MKKTLLLFIGIMVAIFSAFATTSSDENQHTTLKLSKYPKFPGGDIALMNYLANHVRYPQKCRTKEIEGTVVVIFIIDKEGRISDSWIERSVHPALDKEALRVVNSMPRWTPGEQDGKKVNVAYTLPIKFKLQ